MLISAKDAPIPFLYLRVWDVSGNLVPILTWFNTDTMIASVPTDVSRPNSELRTEIGRFEFIVRSEIEAMALRKAMTSDEKELFEHIEVVLGE